ncbi:uncharacterized protein LOC144318523 [Canis aureus]
MVKKNYRTLKIMCSPTFYPSPSSQDSASYRDLGIFIISPPSLRPPRSKIPNIMAMKRGLMSGFSVYWIVSSSPGMSIRYQEKERQRKQERENLMQALHPVQSPTQSSISEFCTQNTVAITKEEILPLVTTWMNLEGFGKIAVTTHTISAFFQLMCPNSPCLSPELSRGSQECKRS